MLFLYNKDVCTNILKLFHKIIMNIFMKRAEYLQLHISNENPNITKSDRKKHEGCEKQHTCP